jgi:hypothetical protein
LWLLLGNGSFYLLDTRKGTEGTLGFLELCTYEPDLIEASLL